MKAIYASIFVLALAVSSSSILAEGDDAHKSGGNGTTRPSNVGSDVMPRLIKAVDACSLDREGAISDPPISSFSKPISSKPKSVATPAKPAATASVAASSAQPSRTEKPATKVAPSEGANTSDRKAAALARLFNKCKGCHGPGEASSLESFATASFNLEEKGEVSPGRALAAATTVAEMKAGLTPEDIELLKEWKATK